MREASKEELTYRLSEAEKQIQLLEKKLAKAIDQRDREIKLNDSLSNEEKLYVIAHRNEELELIK